MKNTHVARCSLSRLNGEVEGSLTSSSRMRGSIMILAIALALASCGGDSGSNADSDEPVSSSAIKKSSSSAESSSSVTVATSCKTEKKDNCEYGSLTDDRDGQTYKTVKIGEQIWMAENLNYEELNSYCYNDSAEYCAKYGRLYTWAAAMDSAESWSNNGRACGLNMMTCSPKYPVRGICPEGWHLPSNLEFKTLFEAVGGKPTAGMDLKYTKGWRNEGCGTDAFGFSALPAGDRETSGRRDADVVFNNEGNDTYFWSSTEFSATCAWGMYLNYNKDNTYLDCGRKSYGFSVRCVKD